MKKSKILFVSKYYFSCHSAVNGSNSVVKNAMPNNRSILTEKKYVVQIYEIKLHTKNYVDWIKNEVPREV